MDPKTFVRPVSKKEFRKDDMSAKKVGVTYKKPFYHFLIWLFEMNASFPPNKKMTDYELCLAVIREYKNHEELVKQYDPEGADNNARYLIKKMRSKYNLGTLLHAVQEGIAVEPNKFSFEYDRDGDPINSRSKTGKKFTLEEIRTIKARHAARRDENLKRKAVA